MSDEASGECGPPPNGDENGAGKRRRPVLWLGFVLGLALIVSLALWQGVAAIFSILGQAGLPLLLVGLATPLFVLPNAFAWQILFEPAARPRYWLCAYGTWIGQSVNNLLPVGTIGGEAAKARILSLRGFDGYIATASVIADKAAQGVAVVMMLILSMLILIVLDAGEGLILFTALSVGIMALGVAGFIALQRRGMFGPLARWLERPLRRQGASDAGRLLDDSLKGMHGRRGRFLWAGAVRLGGAVLLSVEVWFAAQLMGHPVGLLDAVLLRVAGVAVRGALFFVWAGIGVQEGVFVLLGGVLGGSPEFLIALSLATRVRELVSGLPALLFWQFAETRAAIRRVTR